MFVPWRVHWVILVFWEFLDLEISTWDSPLNFATHDSWETTSIFWGEFSLWAFWNPESAWFATTSCTVFKYLEDKFLMFMNLTSLNFILKSAIHLYQKERLELQSYVIKEKPIDLDGGLPWCYHLLAEIAGQFFLQKLENFHFPLVSGSLLLKSSSSCIKTKRNPRFAHRNPRFSSPTAATQVVAPKVDGALPSLPGGKKGGARLEISAWKAKFSKLQFLFQWKGGCRCFWRNGVDEMGVVYICYRGRDGKVNKHILFSVVIHSECVKIWWKENIRNDLAIRWDEIPQAQGFSPTGWFMLISC